MTPLYHLLDPLWRHFPFPAGHTFDASAFEDATVLRMARTYRGREILPVYCYVVGETLVDTGISSVADEVVTAARRAKVGRVVLTHHHEDHSGNAARLASFGAEVLATDSGVRLVAGELPRRFYQHVLWGEADPVKARVVPDVVPLGRFDAHVVPASGHSVDQLALHVPERGWLLSGDAFVAEKIKVFRGDEDFHESCLTLERFLTLDFDALLCAHRPRFTGGKEAIRAKLAWLRELEGRVKESRAKGRSVRRIVRELGIEPSSSFYTITFGDVTTANLVRSILDGPKRRVEVVRALSTAS
ncbi:MAG: MBL fold metallo-hydrolase [Thermoanaerobaculia bacterium]|nr:MBL fold metallo-hydrolase [Thermoanaerobaculia bacterium]